MIRNLFILLVLAMPFSGQAQTDAEVAARANVLELAGAFSNDGFKLRDGHHTAMVDPANSQLLVVNLYAGNDYWFLAGAGNNEERVQIEVFDNEGRLLESEPYEAPGRAAAGLKPVRSGRHYIRIQRPEGAPAPVCFLYTYR